MNQTTILFPMIALAALTFIVLLCLPYRRFKAAFARRVTVKDFKYGESSNVPPDVSIPNRNLMNLLEMPVLFYVVCMAFLAAHAVDPVVVAMAWAYVALRALHSLVHLSYNNVFHRLGLFVLSNLVLIALWIKLLLAL